MVFLELLHHLVPQDHQEFRVLQVEVAQALLVVHLAYQLPQELQEVQVQLV
jgi:hypothetical protein